MKKPTNNREGLRTIYPLQAHGTQTRSTVEAGACVRDHRSRTQMVGGRLQFKKRTNGKHEIQVFSLVWVAGNRNQPGLQRAMVDIILTAPRSPEPLFRAAVEVTSPSPSVTHHDQPTAKAMSSLS
jgi:hypothetical protein